MMKGAPTESSESFNSVPQVKQPRGRNRATFNWETLRQMRLFLFLHKRINYFLNKIKSQFH
jgi:hypothetical protein